TEQRQLRAYVYIETCRISSFGKKALISCDLKNTGQTPAQKLALFGVSSDFDGLLRGFDEGSGVFARRSHFLKLLVYYPVSESGSQHQGPSEPTNDSRPVGHPSLIRLVEGVFLILLALCSAMAIVKASEYADDRGFPWWIPFLIFFGLTYLFGFHGLDLLDAYFDGRESKAVYTATFSGATEAFRSTGDKV
ncbi:MAG: hypothetical protein ACLPKH_14260, partial [Rhodomicrobium sp.]